MMALVSTRLTKRNNANGLENATFDPQRSHDGASQFRIYPCALRDDRDYYYKHADQRQCRCFR